MKKNSQKNPKSNSNSKKRVRSDLSPDGQSQENASPEQDVNSVRNENNAVPSSKKNVPSSESNDKRGFLTLTSSFTLSEEAKYVVEHGFEKSSKEQTEKFLDEIIPRLVDRMAAENTDSDPSVITMLSFLKTLQRWRDYGKRHMVQRLFALFSTSISSQRVDSVWRSHMVYLITKFVQTTHFNEHSKFGLLLLGHLFSVALNSGGKPVTNADIKRIKELKVFILQVDILDPSMEDILASFMSALVSKDFLKNREGILVLAHFLSKEASLVKTVQMKIRDNLSNFTKKLAGNYGEIYFHAWILTEEGSQVRKIGIVEALISNASSEDVNSPILRAMSSLLPLPNSALLFYGKSVELVFMESNEIEQRCIQDIMLRAMTLKRNGLEMGPIGQFTFSILRVLSANRRLTKFSQLITELYQPILWRNLKSHNPLIRCNAAQIFFDVFPLEKVGQGAAANCSFIQMQVKEIKDLLVDECHLVRIISIKGIAPVLIHSSQVLSIADIKDIMMLLTERLVKDSSTPLVPCAVFSTFDNLMASPYSQVMAMPLLKNMRNFLHHVNDKVRKAFLKVVLRLKEIDDPDCKFWDVVPLLHIIYRLEAEECPAVGALLAKLIFSNVYSEGQPVMRTVSNLIKIIKISAVAAMKLFKFGKKEVPVQDAYNILVSIIGVINKQIKEKMTEISNENMADDAASKPDTSRKTKRKPSRTLQNITNRNDSEDEQGTSSDSSVDQPRNAGKHDFLDDHKVLSGLLNTASLLWAIYCDDFREVGKLETINLMATSAVPLLLRYYKGVSVYYTVVSFASLIPIQLLAPHSTVTGACIAEIREMDESSDLEKMRCLAMALCFWGRGMDVVDLAIDWVNQAFRHENLNRTLLPPSNKKRTRVRFQPCQGKPFLGVQLLQMVCDNSACESKLINNYGRFYDAFIFLERIKELVERRLENGEEFKEHDLSDLFLEKCLEVYLGMVILLHHPDRPPEQTSDASIRLEPVSAGPMFSEILNWAHRVFMPHLKEETEPQFTFASRCLHSVLKFSVLAVKTSITDDTHCLALSLIASKLTETGSPLHFLEIIFKVMKSLCDYSYAYKPDDELEIFSLVVPKLLEQCLDVVASTDIAHEDLIKKVENFRQFKLDVLYPLVAFKHLFHTDHRLYRRLCHSYFCCCLALVTREISKWLNSLKEYQEPNDEADIYTKFNSHPFFVSLIMKYFLVKPQLTPLILPWLQSHVIECKQEPIELLGVISILSTLLLSAKGKFQAECLEEVVSKCYETLMAVEGHDVIKMRGEEILCDVCNETGCVFIKCS